MKAGHVVEVVGTRTALRHLFERLVIEYSGALPPGRVVRTVVHEGRRLYRAGARGTTLLSLCEEGTRRVLADEIATRAA